MNVLASALRCIPWAKHPNVCLGDCTDTNALDCTPIWMSCRLIWYECHRHYCDTTTLCSELMSISWSKQWYGYTWMSWTLHSYDTMDIAPTWMSLWVRWNQCTGQCTCMNVHVCREHCIHMMSTPVLWSACPGRCTEMNALHIAVIWISWIVNLNECPCALVCVDMYVMDIISVQCPVYVVDIALIWCPWQYCEVHVLVGALKWVQCIHFGALHSAMIWISKTMNWDDSPGVLAMNVLDIAFISCQGQCCEVRVMVSAPTSGWCIVAMNAPKNWMPWFVHIHQSCSANVLLSPQHSSVHHYNVLMAHACMMLMFTTHYMALTFM
jgi:hypothetical protein